MNNTRSCAVAVLTTAILLALASPSHGATYVVDRGHPQASDANPGSEALPWRTISHAAATVSAGDTVYVKAGTYPERVVIQRSGAAGAEIVFAAYPGHTVTIDGTHVTVPEFSGLVSLQGAHYVRFQGFHVTQAGPTTSSAGIQVEDCSHVTIADNHTSHTASSGILVWHSTNVVVAGNDVERAMTTGAASRNECITVGRTTNFEVANNHVHDTMQPRGEGIDIKDGSSHGSVHHNTVAHVPSVGIYVDAWDQHTHDISVHSNTVHDVDGDGIAMASEQGGLLERIEIYNNVSYHNRYVGLNISDCCIASHPMSDIRIVNNSFWGNGWGEWGGGLANANAQAQGVVIRNNAVAGNLSFEIAFEGVSPAGSTLDHNLIGAWHGYPDEVCGTDCQVGDPRWVNPSAGDFHLQAGSPAIDRGSATDAPAVDFEGTSRPQGHGVDIGAFEYRSGSSCALSCSATVPTTGTAGAPVAFAGGATASDCSGPVTYAWDFGDSSPPSAEQNPSHTYAGPGTYTWRLTARVDAESCTKTGTIAIAGPTATYTWIVPAVAHNPGAAGSTWRTDLAVVNRSATSAAITVTFYPFPAGEAVTATRTLAAGATVEWRDVVSSVLGLAIDTKGAMHAASTTPLFITARTYNQESPTRTYGQYLPALTAAQGIGAGQVGVLSHLKKNAGFRTNLGVVNLGSVPCTVRVRLFGAGGTQVGASRDLTVDPGRWVQQNDIFSLAGAGTQDIAYATVASPSPGCMFWAYASVVDNATNDPTTIPVLVQE